MIRRPRSRRRPLAGQRVLITGGSSGIGLCTAERLGQAGASVVLVARGREGLADAAARVPGCAGTIAADVGEGGQIHSAVQEACELLGGLDAVVAGAGVGSYGPFVEMSPEDYEKTVRITMLGILHTAHATLPHLERNHGTLVVIGSVAGRVPTPWLSAYAAAKHGVRGFVRSLDCELRALRKPVSLALVSPGPVDTPFWRRARTPDRRLAPELRGAYRPEDVATEIVRALCTPGRTERTVGGLMLAPVTLDALLPNFTIAPLAVLARLGWRSRARRPRSDDDALAQPTSEAGASGGLVSRPSALTKLRDLASGRP
jgi:NAD(P)-dependent dehydrogenase (short-subunit alcohol dehydrogenase family)